MNTTTTVATTILEQLGGPGRLAAMTSARNFLDHGNALSFKFKGSRKVNYVKVTLDPSDTYTVEFGKLNARSLEYKVVETLDGVYADMLVDLFEKTTGLYLTI